MAKVVYNHCNFTAGELTPKLLGRTDYPGYFGGCEKLENFIPAVQGGAYRRQGFHMVATTKDNEEVRLLPFVFSENQAYVLEMGRGYVRFYSAHGQIVYTPSGDTYYFNIAGAGVPFCGSSRADTPGGVVSLLLDDFKAISAFDGRPETAWNSVDHPDHVGVQFEVAKIIRYYTVQGRLGDGADDGYPVDFKLQGSATGLWGGEEVTLDTQSGVTWATSYEVHGYEIASPQSFLYYRLYVTQIKNPAGTDHIYVAELGLAEQAPVSTAGLTMPYQVGHQFGLIQSLEEIQTLQSNDVLMLFQKDQRPHKLSRLAHTDWESRAIDFTPPPLRPARHYPTATLTPPLVANGSYWWGIGTFTASANAFLPGDLGRQVHVKGVTGVITAVTTATQASIALPSPMTDPWDVTPVPVGEWWIEGTGTAIIGDLDAAHHAVGSGLTYDATLTPFRAGDVGRYIKAFGGVARITVVNSASQVFVSVEAELTSISSGPWELLESRWGEGYYPRTAALHQNRMWMAGALNEPLRLHGSLVYGWYSFLTGDEDDMGLDFVLAVQQADAVGWLTGGSQLLLGTPTSEWSFGGADSEPITGTAVRPLEQSANGSRQAQPLRVGAAVLYQALSGKGIWEAAYSFEANSIQSNNLSVRADHIMRQAGIVGWCYCQSPDSIVWCCLEDGSLVGLTYNRAEKVMAWHRHPIDGFVESVCSIPHDGVDELWIAVKRTIAGVTQRTIEYMRPEELTLVADAFYVDSGLSYSGAPATVFSNLSHLEGKAVSVLADGLVVTGRTVAAGALTPPLTTAASKVHIGLPYTSELITVPVEPSAQQFASVIQGHNYQILKCLVRMLETGYAEITTDGRPYTAVPITKAYDPTVATQLYSGDREVTPHSSMNTATRVQVKTDKPLPCGITNIISTIHVGDA